LFHYSRSSILVFVAQMIANSFADVKYQLLKIKQTF